VNVLDTKCSDLTPTVNYLNYDEKSGTMFLLSEGGMHYYNVRERKALSRKELFKITCCGIDINHDGSLIAAGDLSG
jgi:hypothetical protein